jgi:murein DD-endopeptidase MepM/ murein hydrolase activator NlpD
MQARPAAAARPEFSVHPLTPLSDRDRRRRPGRRLVTLAVAALALAVAVPVMGAALAPAAPSLSPLAGGVAGAAGQPSATPAPVAAQVPAIQGPPVRVPLLAVAHPADAEGPAHRAFGPPEAPPASSLTGYQWPISVGRVTLPFKEIPGGEFSRNGKLLHDGVDMASFCGAPVSAAHDGVVLAASRHFDDFIGWVGNLGPYDKRLDANHLWNELPIVVVIDDENGYRSMYAHFQDVTVKPGQRVHAGDLIGHEGATGHASGCHVHYGLFSPYETDLFGVRADIIRRMKVPKHEIARIDPLLVLPGGDVALRTRSVAKAIKAAAAKG